jgi:type II pantothenate kinase
MKLGIDYGSTTIDRVLRENQVIAKARSFPSTPDFTFEKAIEDLETHVWEAVEKIYVTGYGASKLPHSFQGKQVEVVDEIKAIGLGGKRVSGKEECLVASVGSGTCLVNGKTLGHVGGTAIGGRTLTGLGRLLLEETDIEKIEALARQGDLEKVDLTMKEIYPNGIGLLDSKATASHFGSLEDYSREDLALGLFNLVGQSIGSVSAFAAKSEGLKEIVFTGKLAHSRLFLEIVRDRVLKIVPLELVAPENAEYATAFGATLIES